MKNSSASTGAGKFTTILFALDGEVHSTQAVDAVATIAKASKAQVRVLNVWDPEARRKGTPGDLDTYAEAEDLVNGIARQLADAGIAATGEVSLTQGKNIADVIADSARLHSADLVAVGSRGRSDLGGLVLGSVSHQVLKQLSCPVLIVRTSTEPNHHAQLKRVLLAVSVGDEVPQAIAAVTTIALAAEATIRVLHVRNLTTAEGMAWVESEEEATAIVGGIVARLTAAGVNAEAKIGGPSSYVGHDIAEAARVWHADLIVMGSRRLSELAGLVSQSVNHDVIHRTDLPVLVGEKS
jgi:nucleotide-binding universal stress UspA family protein